MTVCVRYASRSLDRYAGVELERAGFPQTTNSVGRVIYI
jgi:hypothetical protein